jgi:hypothetical protein
MALRQMEGNETSAFLFGRKTERAKAEQVSLSLFLVVAEGIKIFEAAME